MTARSLAAIMAGAVTALALWPVLGAHRAPAASFTPAPLVRDYESRDRLVSFYERQVRAHPDDQIEMRMLAGLYLQRFREQSDLSDVTRAERLAERSIQLQPQGNTAGQMTLAAALLTYHHFRKALVHERAAWEGEPSNANALAQIASLEMELGEYSRADTTLARIPRAPAENPTVDSVRARLDELTGHLDHARALIATAIRSIDSDVSIPAYTRSWFHMRAGQLAFEAGDFGAAQREYDLALADFPNNAMALMWQARLYRAQQRWHAALAAASRSAQLYPLPQVLGYEADAQRALGERDAAAQTDALIDAEQRLFNTQGINDRLLANYYAQRRVHLGAALRAARSDYAKRGDEIYADDTLGWVLARMGRWRDARSYTERAVRYGTQDAEIQYHAGIVEIHTGDAARGRARLRAALRMNPAFDPFEAADARAELAHG
ncbi:MAG: tetratricopeptide repeat protein [bacterium]|nr:tetratricopeptide repeat protein [bacterium]